MSKKKTVGSAPEAVMDRYSFSPLINKENFEGGDISVDGHQKVWLSNTTMPVS